jgi:hypothetical protein
MDGTVDFFVNNAPVGHIQFLADQTDLLAAKSTTITENVHIHGIVVVGETQPTEVGLIATCGGGCTGGSHAPVLLKLGASYSYSLRFGNSIAKNAVRFNTPAYKWEFSIGQVARPAACSGAAITSSTRPTTAIRSQNVTSSRSGPPPPASSRPTSAALSKRLPVWHEPPSAV